MSDVIYRLWVVQQSSIWAVTQEKVRYDMPPRNKCFVLYFYGFYSLADGITIKLIFSLKRYSICARPKREWELWKIEEWICSNKIKNSMDGVVCRAPDLYCANTCNAHFFLFIPFCGVVSCDRFYWAISWAVNMCIEQCIAIHTHTLRHTLQPQ